MSLSYQQVRSIVFDVLKNSPRGQVAEVVHVLLARHYPNGQAPQYEQERIEELVRQVMWGLLVDRVIVWGMNRSNSQYPFYAVTEYGDQVVKAGAIQPHDPDKFLAHFDSTCPKADPVIRVYFEEAVACHLHGSYRAAVILVGAASEKAILVLVETFRAAITDTTKQDRFDKERGTTIARTFEALKKRLDLMVGQKKLAYPLDEIVGSDLPGVFNLLRRARNDAGHPTTPAAVDQDTVFINLRVFITYVERVYKLIAFFEANAADW